METQERNERNEHITGWAGVIQRAARRVSSNWPEIAVAEDMEQDIRVRILESPKSVDVLASMAEGVRYRALVELGHQIANKKRASHEYFTGQFRYSVDEVRRALQDGALKALSSRVKSSWSAEDYVSSGRDHSDTVLGMVSMEQDLQLGMDAVERINSRYFELINRKFIDSEVFPTGSADSKALQRAVDLLTTKMNHEHKTGGKQYDPELLEVRDWDTYNELAEAREEYQDSLNEIPQPKPELMLVGPDGLGTFNIGRPR